MKRSLTTKLVLAFVLISLVGILTAAIVARQSLTREFDRYLDDQQATQLMSGASRFYAERGTWAGFDSWLRSQRGAGDGPGPDGHNTISRTRFLIVDGAGAVVYPLTRGEPLAPLRADVLASGVPIVVQQQRVGTLVPFSRSEPRGGPSRDSAEQQFLARTDAALAIAGTVMLAVALLLGLVFARLITRPVRELTAAVQQIGSGELGRQVPVRSRDELGMLATQFNQMSSDLAHATNLRRQMTADIAHDLRTPLTVIAGYLEALRDQVLAPTPARLTTMHEETRILLRLVEDLHTLSLADAGELVLARSPADVRQIVAHVAATFQHAATRQVVLLDAQVAHDLPLISLDADQLTRALGNLVSNALRYTPAGGSVTLHAAATVGDLLLSVSDTGSGIAAAHLPTIFERFTRADEARQSETGGSGLGLAIVKSIVVAHGGNVAIQSSVGAGTTVTLTLPIG